MRSRFPMPLVRGPVFLGWLLILLLPACSSYQINIKGESPTSDKIAPIKPDLHAPRAPAVIVRATMTWHPIDEQGTGPEADMDDVTLGQTIQQLRESGFFSDVWTENEGGIPSDAVKLTVKLDRQYDLHHGGNGIKAFMSGFFLLLPTPFVWYDEDQRGQMSLEAINREGKTRRYTSHSEGTGTYKLMGQDAAHREIREKLLAHLISAILVRMAPDENLYALRPGEEPSTIASKRLPAQPRRQQPAADLTSPEPPPPPIY
mgnify:CR=1 FL=1